MASSEENGVITLTIGGIDPIRIPSVSSIPLARTEVDASIPNTTFLGFEAGEAQAISDDFFVVSHAQDASRTAFAHPPSLFACDPRMLVGGRSGFDCRADGGITFSVGQLEAPEPTLEGDSSETGPFAVEIEVLPDSETDGAFEALTAGVYRVQRFQVAFATYEDVRNRNTERSDKQRVPIGFLYFFVTVLLVLWLLMAGIWHAWYMCICPTTCAPVYAGSQTRLLLVWMSVYAVVGNILVWSIGFPFWIGFTVVLGIIMFVFFWFRYGRCACTDKRRYENEVGFACVDESLVTRCSEQPLTCCFSGWECANGGGLSDNRRRQLSSDGVELGQNLGSNDSHASEKENSVDESSGLSRNWDFPEKLMRIFAALVLVFVIVVLIDMGAYTSDPYFVFSRNSQTDTDEFQLTSVTKAVAGFYAFDGFATDMRMDTLNRMQTNWCGRHFHRSLSDDEKETAILESYIERFDIDMTLFDPTDYREYDSVNEWFIRRIRPELRPISPDGIVDGVSPTASSPADARVMAFELIPEDFTFWIKNEKFTVQKFLGNDEQAAPFEEATMFIVRLAPQDYHRFHAPVSGNVTYQRQLGGTIFSVNADAMTSGNLAILNQRTVTIIQSEEFGRVAFVAIGAVCVGSVVMDVDVGDTTTRGDDIGFFQFGGSTVALLFEKGRLAIDDDLSYRSSMSVETLLNMGQSIGYATTPTSS